MTEGRNESSIIGSVIETYETDNLFHPDSNLRQYLRYDDRSFDIILAS